MTVIQKICAIAFLLLIVEYESFAQNVTYRTFGDQEYSKELIPEDLFNQPWMKELPFRTARMKRSPTEHRSTNEAEDINWIQNDLDAPFCILNNMTQIKGQKLPMIYVLFPTAYTNFGRWIPGNIQAEYGPSRTIQYFEPNASLPVQVNTSISSFITEPDNPPKEVLIFNTVYAVNCSTPALRTTVIHNEGIVGLLHAAYYGGDQEIKNAKEYFSHFKGILYWSANQLTIEDDTVN